jgi:NAD(P)-dependent dehydrogenase (short-subunit alcohol dehydrogenase family)
MDAGYRVVLAGRREEALQATLAARGSQGLVVPADVTQEAAVRHLFERAREEYGRVDVLFNNAGTFGTSAPIEDMALEQWQEVIDANLTGAFLCAREAFRVMKGQQPQGGRIINNGSVSAQVPRPHAAAYTASKHAITGLTKTIALEGRQYGIACGQIDIGNAGTEMTKPMEAGVPQADGRIAVEPRIDPAEVGAAIVHMASLPLSSNVLSMTLMATKMPYVGRG